MKHGIGMGVKCKTDRYFITDVIEKLTQKAFVVVADAVIDELKCKREKYVDDEGCLTGVAAVAVETVVMVALDVIAM